MCLEELAAFHDLLVNKLVLQKERLNYQYLTAAGLNKFFFLFNNHGTFLKLLKFDNYKQFGYQRQAKYLVKQAEIF